MEDRIIEPCGEHAHEPLLDMILFPVMLQNKEGLRVCLQRGSTCHLGELGAPSSGNRGEFDLGELGAPRKI